MIIENALPILMSAIAPLLLISIENVLPYPYLIEELAKLLIVMVILHQEKQFNRKFFYIALLAGVLFALSESVFYLINIFALGDVSLFPKRLLATGVLHAGTIMLMYYGGRRNRAGLFLALLLSMVIHFGYNAWVAGML